MNKIRGLQDIPRTMKHTRSSLHSKVQNDEYVVFNELAQLGREKARLIIEKKNWQEKVDRIDARLREIEELGELLQQEMTPKEKMVLHVQDAKQAAGKEGREVVVKY